MTQTEKLRTTMAALEISADGLRFTELESMTMIDRDGRRIFVPDRNLLHSAILVARAFGRER